MMYFKPFFSLIVHSRAGRMNSRAAGRVEYFIFRAYLIYNVFTGKRETTPRAGFVIPRTTPNQGEPS